MSSCFAFASLRPVQAVSLVLTVAATVSACGASSPPVAAVRPAGAVRATSGAPPAVETSTETYPPTYPVLAEAELERRTAEAQARTPEWSIVLDQMGLLSTAACNACSSGMRITPDDHALVKTFLSKQGQLVALDSPGVSTRYDNGSGILVQQRGPSGPCGNVHVSRQGLTLMITGHLWPTIPSGTRKADDELERELKRRDATPDLIVKRGYQMTARNLHGPVQHREVACLYAATDDLLRAGGTPLRRPCVDVHTGEDITEQTVGTSISTSNAKVTGRTLTR